MMGYSAFTRFLMAFALVMMGACASEQKSDLNIVYDTMTLGNGLTVVFHEDRSDPIVAVAIVYHVGSDRETPGRTGFAHLFEHIMFQQSQNVGQDQLFKKIQDAGGTLNGFTTFDGTTYYEVVPKNALEMVLWLESDRMGYLLSTLDQAAFENQQEVVQNEKRQRVDNVPYGHTGYVIHKALYPDDHPYNWQVIGSLEDLKHATLQDVKDFFTTWYGPNNATLVIAGDFDRVQTKQWIEQYFGEIKASDPVQNPGPMPVALDGTKRYFHEDNFASSPELNLVFPTVQNYEKDAYALSMLSDLLADGKKAPLYKVLVEDRKLAPSVSAFQSGREIDGYLRIRIRAFPGKSLTEVEQAIKEAFGRFETDGFTARDLARIKARTETRFYNGITSILNKAFQLSSYAEYAGSPGFITQDLKNTMDVTEADIRRVYNTYIKDKPYVLTSFVPAGQTSLVAENSERFPVVEEPVVAMTEAPEKAPSDPPIVSPETAQTSAFDRSIEPPKGPNPELTVPAVWQEKLGNGLRVLGIEHREVPLVQFSMTLQGGLLLDDPDSVGAANLITDMLIEGTRNRTPVELEEAIDDLGSSITLFTSKTEIVIRVNTLASKFEETYALFEEILLEPRWDEKEFDRIKEETMETIKRRQAEPGAIAGDVFERLVYGEDNILGRSTLGTPASVQAMTIEDLKGYYEKGGSPTVAHISIVGDVSRERAMRAFKSLETKWTAKPVDFPVYETSAPADKPALYFVDVPGAKQSQIYTGYLALSQTDPDYFAASVMNYKLGGSFNGFLNLILREEKGYTYGARSGFSGTRYPGPFSASSAVRSNATFASLEIFRDELTKYRAMITEEDLTFTKNALIQSNARRFETYNALIGMLDNMAVYDRSVDYIKQEEGIIRNMTREQHQRLAEKYIDPNRMIYLVVGDAQTQLKPLEKLGLGSPVLLTVQGQPASAQ